MAYLLFFILVVILSNLSKNRKFSFLLLFALCVSFLGFRYNVGTDYQHYQLYFETGNVFFFEPANQLIYYISGVLGDEVKWSFFLYSFISYVFLFAALKDFKNSTVTSLLIISTFIFLANGMRQGVAIMIFLYACKYIHEKKLLFYMFYIFLASLFHTSILITLPLYFIVNRSLVSKWYIIVYLLSLIFTRFDLSQMLSPFESIILLNPKYVSYMENRTEGYFSFGVLFEMFLYVLLLVTALRHNFHKRYPIIFNLFFLAAILFNMRIGAYILNRVVIIFSIFRAIVAALLITDKLCHDKYKQISVFIIILSYMLLILQPIYFDEKNCMIPYKTIFFY